MIIIFYSIPCFFKINWIKCTQTDCVTIFHVRHAIYVTLVTQEEQLVPDLKNIKKEVETVTSSETRKCSSNVEHKSAITDHADRRNCVIDWEGAKVVDKETNRCARWIKEAIWIRKTKPTMNRDEGGYRLSHVWDSLLATPSE